MTPFVAIPHAVTAWNEGGRIQGRHDEPLSDAGRTSVAAWRLPTTWRAYDWLASPLRRATETARLLGIDPTPEPRLIEMDWGDWSGARLADLRRRDPEGMARNEARGLDFRPCGGESYREVQDRLRLLLAERATAARPTVAVCHMGVILSLLALAGGWDLTEPPPARPRRSCAQELMLDDQGRPHAVQLNRRLLP